MFIKLHTFDGYDIFVDTSKIVYFREDDSRQGCNETIINFGESFIYVTETPDEIKQLVPITELF